MADLYVSNSLSNLTVKFSITLRYFVLKGAEGDHKWILELGTTHPDINGDDISSIKVNLLSHANLDDVLEESLATLCDQIDWSPLITDNAPPFVSGFSPVGDNVEINSNVYFKIKELLPSAGIDISSVKVYFQNTDREFDVTSDLIITGDPYEYALEWSPDKRVYSRYNS